MEIMASEVKNGHVVMLELGLDKWGNPVYRVTWFNGVQWGYSRYRRFNDAYSTYKLIRQML